MLPPDEQKPHDALPLEPARSADEAAASAGQEDQEVARIAALAASLFGALDAVFVARDGTVAGAPEAPSSYSAFARHVIAEGEALSAADVSTSPRLASLLDEPGFHFCAGVPVIHHGKPLGALCVFDPLPRPVEATALAQLRLLGGVAADLLHSRQASLSGQAALQREEQRRGIALQAAGLASWVWDFRHHEIECDPLLPVLFGLKPATRVRARTLFANIDRRDLRNARARFREAVNGAGEYEGEYRVRPDPAAPPRWLMARGRVVERNAQGHPLLVFGVNQDVTERKSIEERQKLLLREINHRVKNTLATVQALASQTVRHARQPREFLEAFSGRLQALGAAHNLLSDGEWRGIAMRDLVALEVRPFEDLNMPRIETEGPDLILPPDQALGLGLILHELASNALKYGALSVGGGRVSLRWRLARTRLLLEWTEFGGPRVEQPSQHGFGTILIRRSLGKVLGSTVEHRFLPDGVQASISLPLADEED